jgi:hypothetical protein
MQKLVEVVDFTDYRMLKDFVNLKFTNTTGKLTSMIYNSTTKQNVIDIRESPPSSFSSGDRYIVSYPPSGDWSNQRNKIAVANDSTSWSFFTPTYNDIVYVNSKETKYIFTGQKWCQMIFDIPLQVEIDVYKSSTYTNSSIELSKKIKSELVSTFSSRFGINVALYRSEIIKTVQSIEGVDHCVLINPESDLFFSFDINNFTQEDLLKYSPDYVYFTEDSIIVNII